MNIKEAIVAELGFKPGNDLIVDKAIVDQGLNSSTVYASTHATEVKTCVLQILRLLYSTPDTTSSTGGVTTSSTKYDRANLKRRIDDLEIELGIVEVGKPFVDDASNQW